MISEKITFKLSFVEVEEMVRFQVLRLANKKTIR